MVDQSSEFIGIEQSQLVTTFRTDKEEAGDIFTGDGSNERSSALSDDTNDLDFSSDEDIPPAESLAGHTEGAKSKSIKSIKSDLSWRGLTSKFSHYNATFQLISHVPMFRELFIHREDVLGRLVRSLNDDSDKSPVDSCNTEKFVLRALPPDLSIKEPVSCINGLLTLLTEEQRSDVCLTQDITSICEVCGTSTMSKESLWLELEPFPQGTNLEKALKSEQAMDSTCEYCNANIKEIRSLTRAPKILLIKPNSRIHWNFPMKLDFPEIRRLAGVIYKKNLSHEPFPHYITWIVGPDGSQTLFDDQKVTHEALLKIKAEPYLLVYTAMPQAVHPVSKELDSLRSLSIDAICVNSCPQCHYSNANVVVMKVHLLEHILSGRELPEQQYYKTQPTEYNARILTIMEHFLELNGYEADILLNEKQLESTSSGFHNTLQTNVSKHTCPLCSEIILTKSQLAVHLNNAHGIVDGYHCECGWSFPGRTALASHQKETYHRTVNYPEILLPTAVASDTKVIDAAGNPVRIDHLMPGHQIKSSENKIDTVKSILAFDCCPRSLKCENGGIPLEVIGCVESSRPGGMMSVGFLDNQKSPSFFQDLCSRLGHTGPTSCEDLAWLLGLWLAKGKKIRHGHRTQDIFVNRRLLSEALSDTVIGLLEEIGIRVTVKKARLFLKGFEHSILGKLTDELKLCNPDKGVNYPEVLDFDHREVIENFLAGITVGKKNSFATKPKKNFCFSLPNDELKYGVARSASRLGTRTNIKPGPNATFYVYLDHNTFSSVLAKHKDETSDRWLDDRIKPRRRIEYFTLGPKSINPQICYSIELTGDSTFMLDNCTLVPQFKGTDEERAAGQLLAEQIRSQRQS